MIDHPLRTISYIADIGDIFVLMARRRISSQSMDPAASSVDPDAGCCNCSHINGISSSGIDNGSLFSNDCRSSMSKAVPDIEMSSNPVDTNYLHKNQQHSQRHHQHNQFRHHMSGVDIAKPDTMATNGGTRSTNNGGCCHSTSSSSCLLSHTTTASSAAAAIATSAHHLRLPTLTSVKSDAGIRCSAGSVGPAEGLSHFPTIEAYYKSQYAERQTLKVICHVFESDEVRC
ncbi:unnamed protein product [Protopolystoma xenopodis]|uniref:PID domain-containing protein n=1 Tax=Protopolystoma xenopodis TaxID=117903 RepID=A0A448WUZ4_9PLAT|nr:unnamed protein product [Protopolystoma xenopodis]